MVERFQKLMLDNLNLVGCLKSKAIAKLEDSGFKYRIVRENDESFAVTCDYRVDRYNLSIDDNIVTEVSFG